MPTKVDWQSWARQMGLAAAIVLASSGIVATLAKYPYPYLSYYSIALGVLIYLWEYPIPGFDWCGPVKTNFFVRGIGYILLSVPAFLQAATLCSGLFLVFSGIWYMKAGFVGEVWTHPNARVGGEDGGGGGGGGRGGRGGNRGDKKDEVKSVIAAPAAAMYTPPSSSVKQPVRDTAFDPYSQPASGGMYQQPPRGAPATPPMPGGRRPNPPAAYDNGYGNNEYNDGSSTPPVARRPSNPHGDRPANPYGGSDRSYQGSERSYNGPGPQYGGAPPPRNNYGPPQPMGYGPPQPAYGAPPPRPGGPGGRPAPPNRPPPPY